MTLGNGMKIGLLSILIAAILFFHGCTGNKSDHINVRNALAKDNAIPLVIAGSGLAGLTAGVYGARGMVRTVVIQGSKPGGLLMDTTEVENWPGERTIMGPALVGKIRKHAQDLGVEFMEDSIESIDFSSWPYRIQTENGTVLHALSLIIATGATPLYLGIPGEQEFLGRGVGTCAVCDASFYKNEDVIVVGGGDSAIEEALQLAQYAKSVTILVRKDRMRAAPRMQARLKDYPSVKVIYNIEVLKVVGNEINVTGLEIFDNKTQKSSFMPINGFFLAIGHSPNSKIFSSNIIKTRLDEKKFSFFGYQIGLPKSEIIHYLGTKMLQGTYLETDDKGYIKTIGRTQATSIPGVFAAGEVEDSRYRQAIVEAGRGSSAALDALAFLTDIGFTPAIAVQLDKKVVQEERPLGEAKKLDLMGSLDELKNFTESSVPVFLDFYTDSCGPCKQMMPIVESVAQQFEGKMRFFKVNAEKSTDLVEKFFVYKVPCFIILEKGKLLARYNEMMNRNELIGFINQFIHE